MKSAIIPNNDGGRVIAWTCQRGDDCTSFCGRRNQTEANGSPEDVAIDHARNEGLEHGKVHTVNSGCRQITFRVWRTAKGYQTREVLR